MKRMLFLILVVASALPWLQPCSAQALKTAPIDARIRSIPYDPLSVVDVNTALGYQTVIEFDQGETLVEVVNGLAEGWDVARLDRVVVIRPRKLDVETNLSVITNKRIYAFLLRVNAGPESKRTGKVPNHDFLIRFSYADNTSSVANPRGLNLHNADYSFQGAEELVPVAIDDDSRFTYLTFGTNQAIPAIFSIGADGSESLVNQFSVGNTVVVKQVSSRFTLRLGQRVACVLKQKPITPLRERTSTSVPGLVRELSHGDPP